MANFRISDMTCSGCVRAITGAVHDVDASATVDTDLETKQMRVASNATADALAAAMRYADFNVEIN